MTEVFGRKKKERRENTSEGRVMTASNNAISSVTQDFGLVPNKNI